MSLLRPIPLAYQHRGSMDGKRETRTGYFGLVHGVFLKNPDHYGVTVIELLVVMSAITLLLAVGVPKVEDYAIRARLSEGFAVARAARQAVRETCSTNPGATINSLDSAGFGFEPTKYVAEVILAADCSRNRLWVGVITQNTGAHSDPYFAFVTVPTRNGGRFNWVCHLIRGDADYVPAECTLGGT